MTDQRVLEIIARKTSIPEAGETFDEISRAYDRAIEIIREHIRNNDGECDTPTGLFALYQDVGEIEDILEGLELTIRTYQENANVFLHGVCGIFAIALHEKFGYRIFELQDSEDRMLVHQYCEHNGCYIDIRGKTGSMRRMEEPFEDFFTDPVVIERSPEQCQFECMNDMSKVVYENYLQAAKQFIEQHIDYYK